MLLQLAFVLIAIIIGARIGGIGLGVLGGLGLGAPPPCGTRSSSVTARPTADSPISGNDGLYARPFTAANALDGAEARRHGGRPRAAEARRGEDRRVCRRA